MTFDQFANQGGPAAWDPEAAAATKKVSDRIFSAQPADDSTPSGAEPMGTDDDGNTAGTEPESGEVPDPDLTLDP